MPWPPKWSEAELKSEILRLTREYAAVRHARKEFVPGGDVPYSGRVFDADEVVAGVNSVLDFWLTLGPEGEAFEKELAKYLGVTRSVLVNSGSSANLVALSALTSPSLGDRQLRRGDEVITAAAGFPTTVAPIVQCGLVPVFVDSDPITLNVRADLLEAAVSPRTKAVMLAHALGNPFNVSAVIDFCRKHGLWLIEDNCDALGSTYDGHRTGGWGDLSTQSFYPAHHITIGEGGAVNIARDSNLIQLVESFRDWGRHCWCAAGAENTCHKRFGWQLGELPPGYDHKYTYRHLGYNLKPTDIQAAIGREQLKKLDSFNGARVSNWWWLRLNLAETEEFFDFMLPTHAKTLAPTRGFDWDDSGHYSWFSPFGFMLMVKESAPFTRNELAKALTAAHIGNRMFFGGNLVRQPAFVDLKRQNPEAFRVAGDLAGADAIMNRCLFIGVYPGLDAARIDYMIETIQSFCKRL